MTASPLFLQQPKLSLLALALSTTLGLSACGGGGGGSDINPPPPPPIDTQEKATINGASVKGLIKNATVLAFGISNGAPSKAPLFKGNTGESGLYEIKIPRDYSGPILIRVQNNPDNSATMICDSTQGCGKNDFGEEILLGEIKLEAVVADVIPGEEIVGSTTPLTHLAASLAQGLGLNNKNIEVANTKVANLFALKNVLNTLPPDITNKTVMKAQNSNPEAIKHALYASAIARIAQIEFHGDINDTIEQLASQYRDFGGELIIKKESYNKNIISLEELTNAASTTHKELGKIKGYPDVAASAVTSLMAQQRWIDTQPAGVLSDTGAPITAGQSKLAKVKAFVQDFRTWGHVIEQELKADSNAFVQQVEVTAEFFDENIEGLGEALVHGNRALTRAHSDNFASTDLADYLPGVTVISGSIERYDNDWVTLNGIIDIDVNGSAIPTTVFMQVRDTQADEYGYYIDIRNLEANNYYGELNGSALFESYHDGNVLEAIEKGEDIPEMTGAWISIEASTTTKILPPSTTFAGSLGIGFSLEHSHGMTRLAMDSIYTSGHVSTTKGDGFDIAFGASVYPPFSYPHESGDLSLTLGLELANMPAASFTLQGTAWSPSSGDAFLDIAFENRSITIEAEKLERQKGAAVEITNSEGVTMIVTYRNNRFTLGDIKLNGLTYGKIRDTNGHELITYIDGSFESL